jgi:hypothetical protein
MGNLISAIIDFAQKILTIGIISSGILLFAAEVKLAALKKASQGLSKTFDVYAEDDQDAHELLSLKDRSSRST